MIRLEVSEDNLARICSALRVIAALEDGIGRNEAELVWEMISSGVTEQSRRACSRETFDTLAASLEAQAAEQRTVVTSEPVKSKRDKCSECGWPRWFHSLVRWPFFEPPR